MMEESQNSYDNDNTMQFKAEEKQELLEQLMEQIDEITSRNDMISQEISETKVQIEFFQEENCRLQKLKDAGARSMPIPNLEILKEIGGEHSSLLVDKYNKIQKIKHELLALNDRRSIDSADIQELILDSENTSREHEQLKPKILSIIHSKKELQAEYEMLEAEIRSQNQMEISLKRALEYAEKTNMDMDNRISNVYFNDAEEMGQNNVVKNYQDMISILDLNIDTINQRLKDIEEQREEELNHLNEEEKEFKEKVGWESIKERINNQNKEEKEKLEDISSKRVELENINFELQKRYSMFQRLIKKQGKIFKVPNDNEVDQKTPIDLLLKRVENLENNINKHQTDKLDRLNSLKKENSQIELKILNQKEELQRMINKLKCDEAKLRKQINKNRVTGSENEERIIKQINSLCKKRAQKKIIRK